MRALKLSAIPFYFLSVFGASASATLLLYDGFLAGGATPNVAAGEYETGTGYANDDVIGQNPAITGTTGAWQNDNSGYAASVYYRTENVQMGYVDGSGYALSTTAGQLNLNRVSGASSTEKNIYRELDLGNSLPTDLYISLLVRMTPGEELTFRSASTDGNESRRFNFGLKANGKTFVTSTQDGGSSQAVSGLATVTTDVTHFIVVKLHDAGSTNDVTSLYLNPALSSEGLNTADAEMAYGNAYVSGNGAWTLHDIYLRAVAADINSSIEIDEIRFGSTWEDVTPHVIPEPSSLLLLGLGLSGCFLLVRGSRRR